jgi:SAM-dependent methyltransferase
VISEYLLSRVRCPACGGAPADRDPARLLPDEGKLRCQRCSQAYPLRKEDGFLDLRPPAGTFGELTAYADEEFSTRAGPLRPPFLSAGVKISVMSRFLGLSPEDQVLDIGCGNGRAAYFRRSRCNQMVGIDAGAHFAPEALATVDLARGDVRRLPFASQSFDKAYSLDVLEHLNQEGVRAMLSEARRVLRPKGRLFLYSHVMMSSGLARFQRGVNRLVRFLDRRGLVDNEPERRRKSDHLNPLRSYRELESVVRETGFEMEKIRYYNVVLKAVIEDLLLPLAEHNLWRRRRRAGPRAATGGSSGNSPGNAERPAVGRWTHPPLALATQLMKLDVVLFGRVRTGPFFLLLRAR